MKGIVFTEFLEMVEGAYSADLVDEIIDECTLSTHGAYTTVGTYDHNELIQLVVALSAKTSTPVSDLVNSFGQYLFKRFNALYPVFFEGMESSFTFLNSVENTVHTEVKKLYPDAELPSFDIHNPRPDSMTLTYQSTRPLADLAEGLIIGCIDYFGETIEIKRENISEAPNYVVRFNLTRINNT